MAEGPLPAASTHHSLDVVPKGHDMNGHPRRVIALTVVGILVMAGLAGGGWWLGQRGDRQPAASGVTTAPPTNPPASGTTIPATPTSRERVGTWQRLPAAPIPASYANTTVWTGTEMLLLGLVGAEPEYGSRMAYVGAAYNPSTNTWRKLPAIRSLNEGNYEGGSHAVWTGSESLLAGLINGAYNPATDRWRRISSEGLGGAVTVWTGRQVLMWGGGCCGDDVAVGAAYTPETDTWRRLPASPLAGRQHTVGTWTGTELIIVGGSTADGKVFRDAAAYNPATRSWRRLPAMPEPRGGATATWDGSEVLVIGGRGAAGASDDVRVNADGVAYNPANNRWRRLPAMESSRMDHTAVWTGRDLLVWGGRTLRTGSWTAPAHGLAYDPASNRWSALPKSPLRGRSGHVAVWTGTQMLIWGGYPARQTDPQQHFVDGAAYTPYPL